MKEEGGEDGQSLVILLCCICTYIDRQTCLQEE